MAGPTRVLVRAVELGELEATRPLWTQVARGTSLGPLDTETVMARVAARMAASEAAAAAGSSHSYLLAVAYDDELPVGLVGARVVDAGLFHSPQATVVEVLHVDKDHRRSGIGRVLLEAVAAFAALAGGDDICIDVPASNRDASRFYARWGFAPSTNRRTTTVAALRRRVGVTGQVADGSDVTRLRRLVRRRVLAGSGVGRAARPSAR